MGSYGVSKVKYCLSLSFQKLPIPLEMSVKYWNCLQMSYFILDVRLSSKYAYEHITLTDKFCQKMRGFKGVRLSIWSSPQVKQLTDWIHITMLLESL